MTEVNQALVVQTQPLSHALIPRTWEETWSLAQAVAKCSLIPHLKNPDDAYIILLQGLELGLTPMQSVRAIYVVDGKPCMSAELMQALCLQHRNTCQFFHLVSSTDKEATYESRRVGTSSAVRLSYTIEQANRAGLTGRQNWKANPEDMLRRRAASKLARALYPDILMGFSEITDIEDLKEEVRAPVASVASVASIEIKTSGPSRKIRELAVEESAKFEPPAAPTPEPKTVIDAKFTPVDSFADVESDDLPAGFGAEITAVESEALSFLKSLIGTSIDQESLVETAKQIQKAQTVHRITDAEVKTLRGLYAARKMEIEAQAREEVK